MATLFSMIFGGGRRRRVSGGFRRGYGTSRFRGRRAYGRGRRRWF